MNSRSRTAATASQEATDKPANSGDNGSVTFLRSDDAGSQALSSQPTREPATNNTHTVICPSDVSDMSLTEAAYWIATEGGSRECDIYDIEVWKLAFGRLLKKIIEGKLQVLGLRYGDGLHESVPRSHFIGVETSYPYCGQPSDFVTGNKPHLQCWGVLDDEHRRSGFNDKLSQRRLDIEWGDLRIIGADIAAHWPFAKTSQNRSGRKPKYNWPDLERYVFELMDERGEFHNVDNDDNGWHQADLEELAQNYWPHSPGESTIRRYITKFVNKWRAERGKAHN